MNVIFATQGECANFYLDLLVPLGGKISLDKIGFYVTHASNHTKYLRKARETSLKIEFLKEWEMTDIKGQTPDYDLLQSLEKEFGEPFLCNALLADRRIYNGVLAKAKQDYAPRFSHEQMLSILQKGFMFILEFIDKIKPDVIVGGFTPVTFGEYIFYLCAKAKGIRYINLNPTKILNYVTFSEEIYREFPHVRKTYKEYLTNSLEDSFLEKGRCYLQEKNNKYEGIAISSPGSSYKKLGIDILKWPLVAIRYYFKRAYLDNQVRGYHWRYFFKEIYNPFKDRALRILLPYYSVAKLSQIQYAYYPLHVEPEIALSLFGREYLNQIELIRNIAMSLPVTWKLVVKDHPVGAGRRSIGYYKRLLEIPNVVLLDHAVDTRQILENVEIVFTVSGFSGFEAIIQGKAVVTFGKTFYDILPDCMVENVQSLQDLPVVVKTLLENYRFCENEFICLIAAIIKNSTPLNLYEEILKKAGRVTAESKRQFEQRNDFVDFLAKQMQTV